VADGLTLQRGETAQWRYDRRRAPDHRSAGPACGRANGPEFRSWLLELLESSGDRRYERYWQLLAIINGWPATPSVMPAAEWLIAALRSD
jgi:hypothetical protein